MKHKKIILSIISLICLCVISFFTTYKIAEHKDKQVFNQNTSGEVKNVTEAAPPPAGESKKPLEQTKPIENTPAKPKISEVTISSVGDCTIGWDDKSAYSGSLKQVFKDKGEDYSYFFKNVAHIFKEDDITTANLETTFTDSTKKVEKKFNFKAPADYAKSLTLGSIEAVTIANNHTMDYSYEGLEDTKSALRDEGINFFGADERWITEVDGNKFGFLGYKMFSYDKTFLNNLKSDISELKKQGCTVIINFHWGIENDYTANNSEKYVAHYAIDNGADLIIGHHPHVIQGIEKYKGKIIAYSLGNFAFGGNRNPKDKDTFILQTKFKFEDNVLKSYGIKVIPCSISSVKSKNDYCPTPLEGGKKTALLNKLNKLSMNLDFSLKDDFFYIDVNN